MAAVVRLATIEDVPLMHALRLGVRENRLSSPDRVTASDYLPYVSAGSAWVAEAEGEMIGFAAAAAASTEVWALFVSQAAENTGIGRLLHQALIDWASALSLDRLTLTTSAGTRAEGFYKRLGWEAFGTDLDSSTHFMWRMNRTGD